MCFLQSSMHTSHCLVCRCTHTDTHARHHPTQTSTSGARYLWPYVVMALYSYGHHPHKTSTSGARYSWPYVVMALYTYGHHPHKTSTSGGCAVCVMYLCACVHIYEGRTDRRLYGRMGGQAGGWAGGRTDRRAGGGTGVFACVCARTRLRALVCA